MSESCWYQTNMPNLWRYARNRARNLFYDREADVERVMKPADGARNIRRIGNGAQPAAYGTVTRTK